MKFTKLTISLTTALIFTFAPKIALGNTNRYSLSTRSVFVSGCISDNPIDLNDSQAVTLRVRFCLCMLDRFQLKYSDRQFMQLFQGASENRQKEKAELDRFFKQNVGYCL